ncbi:hypothetical protein DFH28DRAFT_897362 [Melampsora americana]|nr:hypothetical protein DFH28DRAFT_897362 [Melampsora americana]
MYNLNKVLEIYKVNGSRVRERVTRYIIVYLNNLPLKYIQIDELTKTLNDILTFGNLSLYDKAHLSFSLYSFEKYHDEEVREKILEFAVKLENSCRSDPDIFRIIWSGEPLEEEQVIRANFDEICKTSSWRAPWAHNIITDNGAYKTSKELLTFIPPEKIAEKMTTALTTLVYSTKYPTPGTQYPSTWDYMYLMKTIYIYQQYFEPMLKDPEFKELKALGDHDWGLLLEAINQCKDSFKLYQISRAPSKVVQMAKAYTDIIYSFSGSKSLIECPGLIEVWIRMADSQQLAPTSKTPKTILEFFQSISGIKSHERLIEKIKGIGEIDSEIPSFHGDHEYLYSKQLLKFLQYLWMNYYINDEIDFQVKEAITWKAFEAYKKIQEPYSETLVAALIGRLEAMYPGKKGRIDHLIEVLAFRNDYIIW